MRSRDINANDAYNVTFRRTDDCIPASISALTGIDATLLPLPDRYEWRTWMRRETLLVWRLWARQYNKKLRAYGVPVRIRVRKLRGSLPRGRWVGLAFSHRTGGVNTYHAMLMKDDQVLWDPRTGRLGATEVWGEVRVNDRRKR